MLFNSYYKTIARQTSKKTRPKSFWKQW